MASSMVRHLRRIHRNYITGYRSLSILNTRYANNGTDRSRNQDPSRLNICQMPLVTSHQMKQFLTNLPRSCLLVNQHKVSMEIIYSY